MDKQKVPRYKYGFYIYIDNSIFSPTVYKFLYIIYMYGYNICGCIVNTISIIDDFCNILYCNIFAGGFGA